jgi:hypothetical protein
MTKTDPACSLSPDHELIVHARQKAESPLIELKVRHRVAAREAH